MTLREWNYNHIASLFAHARVLLYGKTCLRLDTEYDIRSRGQYRELDAPSPVNAAVVTFA
ncbi:hypothetical protein AJ78_08935, partial [Emergomyces pasteurianus Ep9510]